jgi:tetratricopeptide (TPR) repeat protein
MKRLPYIVFGVLLLAGARSLCAQQVNPRVPPPPPAPPVETPAAPQPVDAPATAAAQPPQLPGPIDPTIPPPPPYAEVTPEPPPAPSGPAFDPLHAERSITIGTFYMRKGAYDAAIDRFVEASNYQPSLAAPWKLLGETYEKKREYAKAVESYNKYLQISPRAPDAARINKVISDLAEKIAQESPKKAER